MSKKIIRVLLYKLKLGSRDIWQQNRRVAAENRIVFYLAERKCYTGRN